MSILINKGGNVKKFLRDYYPLLFILLASLILIIAPFIFSNNLEGFDTAGQYANAYYIRSAFWPWPGGWNAMVLTGFPQGLFYPPFFHWLSAAVSFVMPLSLAYKLILSLAVIAFPLIYFILAKKILLKSTLATLALLLSGIFYYFDLGINDNLFADLYFGMSSHLFSLTLFIAYLYFLWSFYQNKGRWQWAGIFLALIIITHAISGFAAVLFGLVFLFLSWQNREIFIKTIKHLILASLLSLWWWLPMLLNISYISGSDVSHTAAPILILLMPFILIISLIVGTEKHDSNIFLKTVSIFSFFIITIYLFGRMFVIQNFPIHVSRLLVYPLLLTPLLFVSLISKMRFNWKKINLALIFAFSFYIFYFRIIPVGPFNTLLLDNLQDYYEKGRVIVTGGSRYLDNRFHITRMKLAIEQNIPISEGLFVESSANGWFIMSMMKSWDNTDPTFVWAYKNLINVIDLHWGANIMAVNYEYRINDLRPSQEEINLAEMQVKIASSTKLAKLRDINKEKEESILSFKNERIRLFDNERKMDILASPDSAFYYQTFYKLGDFALAEALAVRPVNISSDWRENTRRWWSTDWLRINTTDGVYNKPILIYKHDVSDWKLASAPLALPLSLSSQNMDTFSVDATDLEVPAPIYVKVSYFPFWRAFDSTGKQLEIYKASPNFMLVYGQGEITFKYIEPTYYFISFIVSGLALFVGFASLIFLRPKN
ncbi:hypothetical protein JXE04_01905 [Patescibacteria group bacterium]|nr:hypothetical protein [Patescibacteria group bacterium]